MISVVQGTQVSVQPGGVGVTFTPGQALDPINDLVEQFSLLMLGASVSFGVQLALIKFGAYWAVSLMLTAVDESVTDKMKRWWSQNTDVKKRFEELKEIAGRTIEHIIKLIVVFVLQTLVLPLWMLLRLVGALAALSRRKR